MKKFSKVMLIVAAVFALLGLGLCIGGYVIGGSVKTILGNQLARMEDLVPKQTYDYAIPDDFFQAANEEEAKESLFQEQKQEELLQAPAKELQKLSLTLGGGQIAYIEGDKDDICIYVNEQYKDQVEVQRDEEKLEIEVLYNGKNKVSNYPILLIQVPKGHVWEELDIRLMAGQLAATELMGDEVSVSAKAGKFQVNKLIAETADIDTKAGKLEIAWLQAGEADVSCQAGAIEILNGLLEGDADLSCNAGSIKAKFCGDLADYTYDLRSTLGTILLNGEEYQGITGIKQKGAGNGKIEISCNVGSITVDMVEEELLENVTNNF